MSNKDEACGTLSRSRQREGGDDGACGTLCRSPENAHLQQAVVVSLIRK